MSQNGAAIERLVSGSSQRYYNYRFVLYFAKLAGCQFEFVLKEKVVGRSKNHIRRAAAAAFFDEREGYGGQKGNEYFTSPAIHANREFSKFDQSEL